MTITKPVERHRTAGRGTPPATPLPKTRQRAAPTTWRESFLRLCGPGTISGITVRHWLGLLAGNRFAVHPKYWGRLTTTSGIAVLNSLVARYERLAYGPRYEAAEVREPVFILGHWRSGTTLLHHLLSVDPRFASPNLVQILFPHSFIAAEAFVSAVASPFLPERRPMDNMQQHFQIPSEDEMANCILSRCSPYLGWSFPRRHEFYDRYLTFRRAEPAEVERWMSSLILFARKLTWRYDNRSLLFKSPPHTGRIRLLLEAFPDAKFVHIHREPYRVFQSTQRLHRSLSPYLRLQTPDEAGLNDRILRNYKEMYEAFFEERALIPPGRYHEICFEELETAPFEQIRLAYEALDLPDFSVAEGPLNEYIASLDGYKKNSFPELPDDLRERIAREWRMCFEEWGYEL